MGNKYRYRDLDQEMNRRGRFTDEIDEYLLKAVHDEKMADLSSTPKSALRESPITLRYAEISDSLFIGRLSKVVFTIYGDYENILTKWFKSDGCITTIIACQDQRQIGFAMLSEPFDKYDLQDVSELLGIAVEPDIQGKGVGDLLLGAIDRVSVSLNIKWLFLHTAVHNLPARKLYERTGYRPLEIKKNFYPEGQDAMVMCKAVKIF
jgi:ribosomal protein S18 acetylase RimI-like enzyme